MTKIERERERENGSSYNCLRDKWEVWIVLIFAFLYYASYYRSGLNLGGEGGTVGVIAMRLLEGQKPIVDTFLGYNVLWFYPIAWLFEIFGPYFLVIKIYFFSLCTITALLATFLVRRATGSSVLAAGTGLLLVLIPGMQFRNYLPFLAVLNMVTLSQAFVFPHKGYWQRGIWMILAGLALGLTYLIRIDLGHLMTVLVLALLLVFPWSTALGPFRGWGMGLGGVLTIGIFAVALHIPMLWYAHQRGFQQQFLGQYEGWANYIKSQAGEQIYNNFKQMCRIPPRQIKEPGSVPVTTATTAAQKDTQATLSRPSVSDVIQDKSVRRMFAWIVYFPIPIAILIFVGMGALWLVSALKRNFEECQRTLGILVALGCALTLFPQYFFFRPDTPHVSEFMVPFVVTMVLACTQAARMVQRSGRALTWGYTLILFFFCIPDVVAHVSNGLRRESSGSFAARHHRNMEFVASNGVRVLVNPEEFSDLHGLYSAIVDHSKPTDWLICYPYSPTINFMTNRRSYEYNLYTDNATGGKKFDSVTIEKILRFRPAVIVISNNPINRNEFSCFKNWAAPTYEFIKDHYKLVGVYGSHEVYAWKKDSPTPRKE